MKKEGLRVEAGVYAGNGGCEREYMGGARGCRGAIGGGSAGIHKVWLEIGQLIYQTAHPANCRKNQNRVMTVTRKQKTDPSRGVSPRVVCLGGC